MAKISVLGVDLGKNVRSVVGLDASGAVVMRRRNSTRDTDRFGGEACRPSGGDANRNADERADAANRRNDFFAEKSGEER